MTEELAQQCAATGVSWEILCIDDGSSPPFLERNRLLRGRPGIRYEELPENIGRAAIRNLLAERAYFPYLLFMDCDSAVVRADYIQQYIAHLLPDTVLYGGRVYAPTTPQDTRYLLHWKFGTAREQTPAHRRAAQPYHAFMTNNFLIPKAVFQAIRFEERIRHYGHEDTLFGMELQKRGIPIRHLDNPLEHIGLEAADVFLQKTAQAVQNLVWLRKQGFPVETRLFSAAETLKRYRLLPIAGFLLRMIAPFMKRNLLSARPSLRVLDGYKLMVLYVYEASKAS
ncbi:MAG: glycosyltransferase [Saprospiraceae bacterium]|nr:glycosyltransferase [Saprospiraceae bacterium]